MKFSRTHAHVFLPIRARMRARIHGSADVLVRIENRIHAGREFDCQSETKTKKVVTGSTLVTYRHYSPGNVVADTLY